MKKYRLIFILARELGVLPENISLSGKGSELLVKIVK